MHLFRPWKFIDCKVFPSDPFGSGSDFFFDKASNSSDDEDYEDNDISQYNNIKHINNSSGSIEESISLPSSKSSREDSSYSLFLTSSDPIDLFTECFRDGVGYVLCSPLNGVSCYGEKNFVRMDKTGRWCNAVRRKNTKSFPIAVTLSFVVGLLGIDRFYLGYIGLGVIKLLTLGGIGVWWIIDLALISTGNLNPANGYLWESTLRVYGQAK